MKPSVPGIVPAAGLSTRMGRSKPLLDAGGMAFVERVVGALAGGGCDPVLVVVRNPDSPEGRMVRETGARVVVNPDPSDGPISSLRAALRFLASAADAPGAGGGAVPTAAEVARNTETEATMQAVGSPGGAEPVVGCAFCPVDHPRIDAETVSLLYDAFLESDAPIVVPVYDSHRGHPVFFRSRLFPELLSEDLPEGARTVVHSHADEVLEVRVEDAGVLVDIDTRDEYRRHFPDGFEESFQDP